LSSQRNNAEAIRYYRQAVAIVRLLSQKDSNNVQWQVRLALSLGILAESGDSPKDNLSAALAILTPLEAAGQLGPHDKQMMASIRADLARLGR